MRVLFLKCTIMDEKELMEVQNTVFSMGRR
jgi:hypothetical protein